MTTSSWAAIEAGRQNNISRRLKFVDMERVVVIGNSFVRRMERVNLNFQFQKARVRYCGYIDSPPINFISQAQDNFSRMMYRFTLPQVVVLILGTNDICSEFKKCPWELADALVKLAQKLLNCGVKQVLMVEVLPRYGRKSFRRSCPFAANPNCCAVGDMERVFFERMKAFNARVQDVCRTTPGMSFVKLKGLHLDVKAHLEDGLHLSITGRAKLRKAIRKDAIVALQRCMGKKC